jgi:hypothetical protein
MDSDLGPAGGSGVLAVLFPKWFGTVDRFVLGPLLEVLIITREAKTIAQSQVTEYRSQS